MRDNPEWFDKAMKKLWRKLEKKNLPMPVPEPDEWEFEELGCGYYGCVVDTEDDNVVFKVTSDESESEFVKVAMKLAKKDGWPSGITPYYGRVYAGNVHFYGPGWARQAESWGLWRMKAINVGLPDTEEMPNYLRKAFENFSLRLYQWKTVSQYLWHMIPDDQTVLSLDQKRAYKREIEEAYDWAWDNVTVDMALGETTHFGGVRFDQMFQLIASMRFETLSVRKAVFWRACELIAETMMHEYLCNNIGEALTYYLENDIVITDLHDKNVGEIWNPDDESETVWVITDPGQAVVLR